MEVCDTANGACLSGTPINCDDNNFLQQLFVMMAGSKSATQPMVPVYLVHLLIVMITFSALVSSHGT
jgi:hypothetical protein